MAYATYGELRQQLIREGIKWTVNPKLTDTTPVRRPALGGDLSRIPVGTTVPRIDVEALVRAAPTTNSLLRAYLVERGVLPTGIQFAEGSSNLLRPRSGGPAAQVDWRNRFGWSWITQIRDQDPCEHCWIYGATALVEAMVRIEHCVWCIRTEGDYMRRTNPVRPRRWSGRCLELDTEQRDIGPGLRSVGRPRPGRPLRRVLERPSGGQQWQLDGSSATLGTLFRPRRPDRENSSVYFAGRHDGSKELDRFDRPAGGGI